MNIPIVQLKTSDIKHVRDMILDEQGGICIICGDIPKVPCLDHEHQKRIKGTGLVRGVLCSPCNVFLAKIENNSTRYGIKLRDLPRVLRNVSKYLDRPHTNYRHPSEKPQVKRLMKSSYNELVKALSLSGVNVPMYPTRSGMTPKLRTMFNRVNITPKYYGD